MFERNSKIFWLGLSSIAALILINIIGYYSAYALINYRPKNKIALGYPRPENRKTPADLDLSYQSDRISLSNQGWIETWWIATKPTDLSYCIKISMVVNN